MRVHGGWHRPERFSFLLDILLGYKNIGKIETSSISPASERDVKYGNCLCLSRISLRYLRSFDEPAQMIKRNWWLLDLRLWLS